MKKLKVKRRLQKVNSLDCGPVAVQMVLDYFGIQKTTKELKKDLYYGKFGTYLYDLGILFLNEGLEVTLITANSILFSGKERKKIKTKKAVREHLTKLLKSRAKELQEHKRTMKLFVDFIDQGGDVVIEIPQFKHVREAINKNKLVIPNFHLNAMGVLDESDFDYHTFVITGFDSKHVYFEDPYPKVKTNKALIEDFMFAVHAGTSADIDNGSFLVISN